MTPTGRSPAASGAAREDTTTGAPRRRPSRELETVPDFIDTLKEQVARYGGALRDVVLLAPAYASLMVHLLNDPRLARDQRLLVDAALAYLVSPDDVIPEEKVGAYGYLDDIFCCAYVATRIAEDLGWDVVEEAWTGEQPAHTVSERVLGREQELLGHAGDDVLRFAGLLDRLEPRGEAVPEIGALPSFEA